MPRLREETRAARRRHLLDAAWRCAAGKGFRDMTLDEICLEAGVTKGAFYAHFESKQELLEAMIDDDNAEVDRLIGDLQAQDLAPVARLRRLAQVLLERGGDPSRVQLRADLWNAILSDPGIRRRANQGVQNQRVAIRSWIADAAATGAIRPVPENALASVLLALDDGLLLHHALDPSAFRWANISVALDALFGGLTP